jgi:hypothetical protein
MAACFYLMNPINIKPDLVVDLVKKLDPEFYKLIKVNLKRI